MAMSGGVAAGHLSTAEAGIRMMRAGGGAADAAVAAMLACCVAESIFTSIGGGGFATYFDAASGDVTCLDFFCSVPGRDGNSQPAPMRTIDVSSGGVAMDYKIGGGSIAVPGAPAGAAEIHRRWGRLPWPELVEPAVTLAAQGVLVSDNHAHVLRAVAPALTAGDGATCYAPQGRLLEGGDTLKHPGLETTMRALADDGAAPFYAGWVADRIVAAAHEAGSNLSVADMMYYRVHDVPVRRAHLAAFEVVGRQDLNGTIRAIASLPENIATLTRRDRAVAIAESLSPRLPELFGETTNISVRDGQGNACVVTLSTGVGSGVWVPGLGLHLNSMLGEGELLDPARRPGERVASMMCPLIVLDRERNAVLAVGSAGASRIRSALMCTLIRALIDEMPISDAVAAPRMHPAVSSQRGEFLIHAEADYPRDELDGLKRAGYTVRQWDALDMYFGGVSAVSPTAAAGDPRRGGLGLVV